MAEPETASAVTLVHEPSRSLVRPVGDRRCRIDQLRGEIDIRPSWPTDWGDTLTDLPVFLPGFQAQVNACYETNTWQIDFRLKRMTGDSMYFNRIKTRLPDSFDPATTRIDVTGCPRENIHIQPDGLVQIHQTVYLEKPDDGFTITAQPGRGALQE